MQATKKRTAISAFLDATASEKGKSLKGEGTPKPRGESNLFMESLFTRHPIKTPTPLTKEMMLPGVAKESYTVQQNPFFAAAGEVNTVPVLDVNIKHSGTECKPNERLLQVVRYGRVYKRKSPSYRLSRIRVNAPPGMRYCRFCEDFQPLDAFYSHIKRYVCRKHHSERVFNADNQRNATDVTTRMAADAWADLAGVRDVLGYANVNFDRSDIRELVIHSGLPWGIQPRVLPIDPSKPMRPRNVAVVSSITFQHLVALYKHTCSPALFIAHVQRCNLLPHNFDPGWPDHPFHDPTYSRVDIDVGPMLLEEVREGLGPCVDRTRLEAIMETEPAAPWHGSPERVLPAAICTRARIELNERRQKSEDKKRRREDAATTGKKKSK